jgi:hypothetical protein
MSIHERWRQIVGIEDVVFLRHGRRGRGPTVGEDPSLAGYGAVDPVSETKKTSALTNNGNNLVPE